MYKKKVYRGLHCALHVVDEEMTPFDQSDVEPATEYQPQAECGSSTSDSDDQIRKVPIRDSPPTAEERKQQISWSWIKLVLIKGLLI